MRRTRYLLVVVAVLIGCGGDEASDAGDVEGKLARIVERQTGTRDVVVRCADDVAEGDLCEVKAAGGVEAKVRVTRIDEDDVSGEVVQP